MWNSCRFRVTSFFSVDFLTTEKICSCVNYTANFPFKWIGCGISAQDSWPILCQNRFCEPIPLGYVHTAVFDVELDADFHTDSFLLQICNAWCGKKEVTCDFFDVEFALILWKTAEWRISPTQNLQSGSHAENFNGANLCFGRPMRNPHRSARILHQRRDMSFLFLRTTVVKIRMVVHYLNNTADFLFIWTGCGMKSDFGAEFPCRIRIQFHVKVRCVNPPLDSLPCYSVPSSRMQVLWW